MVGFFISSTKKKEGALHTDRPVFEFPNPGTAKDMDRQLLIFSFFGWPLFVKGSCMAKVLGVYGTTRCQIKDMDIVFLQVPHNPVLAKWFGYCDAMKYGSF